MVDGGNVECIRDKLYSYKFLRHNFDDKTLTISVLITLEAEQVAFLPFMEFTVAFKCFTLEIFPNY